MQLLYNIIVDKQISFYPAIVNHIIITLSTLTAMELKCVQLKTRNLKFLCTDCECSLVELPFLKSLIKDLKSDIEIMKTDIIQHICHTKTTTNHYTDVINTEIQQRQDRTKNINAYNVHE